MPIVDSGASVAVAFSASPRSRVDSEFSYILVSGMQPSFPPRAMTKLRAPGGMMILSSLLLLSSGCATTRRHPVVPLPVRLVSPTPFFAHVRARADTAATYCQVLRISGTVAAVRGDTLEFAAVASDLRPRGAADCLEGRAGFVVLSSAPGLQAETAIVRNGRTVGLVLLVVPLTAFLTLAALIDWAM